MDQERRSQREMMQENEKQARTTYTNAQAKAAMSRRDNKASKLRVELTDPRKSNYFYEEALKTLRTNIQFAGADIKTILVTSCFPNEGKSDVVFQLAKEMGMAGKKTVLLDADIRKSVLVQRYLVDSDVKGLSQYLSGQAPVRDILYGTNYENMDVIFAGPMAPNPSELLNGKVFAKLMIELKQRYDYVLIDTPPMANVVDAAIVGKVCDGAILLIESGFVGYRAAQKAIKQLEKSGTHMLGAVLNKVDARKEKYYSYYSYGMVDVQKDSLEMDYNKLANAITEKTKVVIPVDLGGVPCDYNRIFSIVESKKELFHPVNKLQKAIGIMINSDRNKDCSTKADYFDADFNYVNMTWGYEQSSVVPSKPLYFEEMKMLAEKLSKGMPHVRIDFYIADNRVYFGEMTFFDGSGFDAFGDIKYANMLGEWIKLPEPVVRD